MNAKYNIAVVVDKLQHFQQWKDECDNISQNGQRKRNELIDGEFRYRPVLHADSIRGCSYHGIIIHETAHSNREFQKIMVQLDYSLLR